MKTLKHDETIREINCEVWLKHAKTPIRWGAFDQDLKNFPYRVCFSVETEIVSEYSFKTLKEAEDFYASSLNRKK